MTKQDSAIEYTMAEQDFLYAIDFIGQQYLFIISRKNNCLSVILPSKTYNKHHQHSEYLIYL